MFEVRGRLVRFFCVSLLVLIILSPIFLAGSEIVRAPLGPAVLSSFSGVHRTYWLRGDLMTGWNKSIPGPMITASDGDNVTIMLLSSDSIPHDFQVGPYVSPNFSSSTIWTNFTFTPRLNQTSGFSHGGTFTYECIFHPGSMFGNFQFLAGPVASFVYSPSAPLAGNTVLFNGSASWPSTGARIVSYRWDFGDGYVQSSGILNVTQHVYVAAATYLVVLNVTDSASQTAGSSMVVTVNSPPPLPFDYGISLSSNKTTILPGQGVTVVVGLGLVSGVAENVTLSLVVLPASSTVHVMLNKTSGFPSFTVVLSIGTDSSSFVGIYTVRIAAVSGRSHVAHNADFTLVLASPTSSPSPNYVLWGAVGGFGVVSGLAFALLRRSRRRGSPTSPPRG